VPSRRHLPLSALRLATPRTRVVRLLLPVAVVLQVAGLPVLAGEASTEPQPSLPERPAAVQARMSDTVADGAGVNVHLLYGRTQYADFPAVQAALADLGVRHVRDLLGRARTDQYAKVNALAAAGVQTTFTLDKVTDLTAIGPRLDMIAGNMASAVEAVEPPNEYNYSGSPTWAEDLRAYQPELHAQVRSRPELDGVRVLGPSLARREGYTEVGDLSAHLDAGNVHTYPGGHVPTRNLDLQLSNAGVIAGAKPVVVTEAGYHNALATTTQHRAATEEAAGVYTPRLLLEYHQRGVRSYLYELFDQNPEPASTDKEMHFGLVRADGTPKPAYDAVKNLLRLTSDPGPAFVPAALSYTATSSTDDLRQTLLQRRDGSFVLLLWRDVAVWDPIAQTTLEPAPAAVDVRLGDGAIVTTHRPSAGSQPHAVTPYVRDVEVSVGADVTALVIEPAPQPVSRVDAGTTDEDVALVQSAPGVLANDAVGAGATLTARLVDGPEHGTLALAADGSYRYTPDADFAGVDAFHYVAEDGLSTGPATVVELTVRPVNDLPSAVADSWATAEDTVLEVSGSAGVLRNDADVDGDALTAQVVVAPAHGALELLPDGGLRYVPALDRSGPDSFRYRVVDSAGATSEAQVALTVTAVNDAPVNVLPASLSMLRNTTATFSAATGTRVAVTDVDRGAGQVKVTLAAAYGKLTLKTRAGLTFHAGDGVRDSRMVFRGTLASVNAALDGSTFRPKTGFVGIAGLTVTSDDLSGTATATDVDRLSIAVR
jgi:hypothetical protein